MAEYVGIYKKNPTDIRLLIAGHGDNPLLHWFPPPSTMKFLVLCATLALAGAIHPYPVEDDFPESGRLLAGLGSTRYVPSSDGGLRGLEEEYSASCSPTLTYNYFFSEIEVLNDDTDKQFIYSVPLYNDDGDQIGTGVAHTFFNNNRTDCTYTQVDSFGYNETTGTYKDQLMITGTCLGASNALVGGTFGYAGAEGWNIFILGNGTGVAEYYVCQQTCDSCGA